MFRISLFLLTSKFSLNSSLRLKTAPTGSRRTFKNKFETHLANYNYLFIFRRTFQEKENVCTNIFFSLVGGGDGPFINLYNSYILRNSNSDK